MENEIAVSIICNAYNHEKYIRDALDGFVSQQTSFPFEVLVHDDASTDSTADIIREYEKKYPDLIKPIYQTENQYSKHDGGIKKLQGDRAKGKYIALCEGDDYWTDPLKLQKQYDFMEQHPDYTLCGCSTEWLNMLTGKVENKSRTPVDVDVTLEEFADPKNGRPFPTVSFFMPSEIWKDLPYFGFPVGDIPLTLYAATKGKVRMLADTMCVYRWYAEGSWTARKGHDGERAKVCRRMIYGMENLNKYTDYRYEDIFRKRILYHQYTLALMNHDFKAITSGELLQMYKSRDFVHRLSDRIRCKKPKLYFRLQKILGRNQ